MQARGEFDVTLTPQGEDGGTGDSIPSRLLIDKRFHGDLNAVSKGQMLAARTGVEGSAGYVALEKVSGTLGGRSGTFVLQHSGRMSRGDQQLTITVVPDSGTDELSGLRGDMKILMAEGKHSYEFEYSFE